MIITQTPLRISLFGGGTDFPDFYLKESGCVLSSAIDRYIFVIIKQRFDDKIRVGYTRTELCDDLDSIQHDLVREALRKTGIKRRVEIATMGDIASSGSGLGSSSTVTVGLLNAMYQYVGRPQDAAALARQACEIELHTLGKPIGVQDQYIAAYGGQRLMTFQTDGRITVDSLDIDEECLDRLNDCLMLFSTNMARQAESVLAEQKKNIESKTPVLREMRDMAFAAAESLRWSRLNEFGDLLHQSWTLKKSLASNITNAVINQAYQAARRAGALGGKIAGAGGGGYLLLFCPPERQERVRSALSLLPELPFSLERAGSKVIFDYSRVTTRPVAVAGRLKRLVASAARAD